MTTSPAEGQPAAEGQPGIDMTGCVRDGHTVQVVITDHCLIVEVVCPFDGADLTGLEGDDIPACRRQYEGGAFAPWYGPDPECQLALHASYVGGDIFATNPGERFLPKVVPFRVGYWRQDSSCPGGDPEWWMVPDLEGVEAFTEYGTRHIPSDPAESPVVIRRVDEEDARFPRKSGRGPITPMHRQVARGPWTPLPAAPTTAPGH